MRVNHIISFNKVLPIQSGFFFTLLFHKNKGEERNIGTSD